MPKSVFQRDVDRLRGKKPDDLSITVRDPRINQGRATNVPLSVSRVTGTTVSSIQREQAIETAVAGMEQGRRYPSYDTTEEAASAAKGLLQTPDVPIQLHISPDEEAPPTSFRQMVDRLRPPPLPDIFQGTGEPTQPTPQQVWEAPEYQESLRGKLPISMWKWEDTPPHQIPLPYTKPDVSRMSLEERHQYQTRPTPHYVAGLEGEKEWGPTSMGRTPLSPWEQKLLHMRESPTENYPAEMYDEEGLEGQEARASHRAMMAIYQWERDTEKQMPLDQRTAMFYTYLKHEGGPEGPAEYKMAKQRQQAESDRPEELPAWDEAVRAFSRAPYEMIQAFFGGGAGMLGGAAETVGWEGLADPLQQVAHGARLEMSPYLTDPDVRASREALEPFNPGSAEWWTLKAVTLGTRMPFALGGGVPGAIGAGVMEAGPLYYQILEATDDEEKAGQCAMAYAVVASITERIGAKVLLTNKQFVGKMSRAVWMSLYRGGIEGTQEAAKLLTEYVGTGYTENEMKRLLDAIVTGALVGGVSSYARPIRYGEGEGVRPKLPSDVDRVDVRRPFGSPARIQVETPRAGELPESVRTNPKTMRSKINQLFRHMYRGDRLKAQEAQRQAAQELFGKKHLTEVDDLDDLAQVYDYARQYQPLGLPKVKDDPQTNASLHRLVKQMETDQTMTSTEFQNTMQDTGIRPGQRYISQSQAKRLRRHFMAQKEIGQLEARLAVQRAKKPGIDEVLRAYEDASGARRKKQEGKLTFGPYRGFQSMRHWAAQLDNVTGLPWRRVYDAVTNRKKEATAGEGQFLAELAECHRKARHIINRIGPDAERVKTAAETGKYKGLSEAEIAVAKQIRQHFKNSETEVKVKELYDWLMGGEAPRRIAPKILDQAQRAYDLDGMSALYKVAQAHDFGVRQKYYVSFRNREKRSIAQDMAQYYRTTYAANMINPELNAFNVLAERATKLPVHTSPMEPGVIESPHTKPRSDRGWGVSKTLKDPGAVAKAVTAFNQSIRSSEPDIGPMGRVIQKGVGVYLKAYYVTQIPTIRNMFQVLAMDQNLSWRQAWQLVKGKRLSPADMDWLRTYAQQGRGLQKHMLLTQTNITGLKHYDAAANKAAKTYLGADRANRLQSVTFSLIRTRAAMDAAPKNWKESSAEIYKVIRKTGAKARFDDVTMQRAVEELATGEDAFARYIALQHTLDVQGAYNVYERSPAEQQAGPVVRRLASWTRIIGELHGRCVGTIASKKSSPAARDQAAVTLARLMLTEWAANGLFQKVTGLDRNPYNLPMMLQFTPVGLGASIFDRVYRTVGTVADAFMTWEWDAAGASIDDMAERFAPFYKTIKQVYDATVKEGVIDVSPTAQVKLSPISRARHALFGEQEKRVYQDIRNKRPRRERPKTRERRKRLHVEE